MNERNPFSKKTNERFDDDQSFLEVFSPVVLESIKKKTQNQLLEQLVIFRSPPGFGKSTLLRLFSAGSLAILQQRKNAVSSTYADTIKSLDELDVFGDVKPKVLGVYLNLAEGFGEIQDILGEESFPVLRALLNVKLILKFIASIREYYDLDFNSSLDDLEIETAADVEWPWGKKVMLLSSIQEEAESIESEIVEGITRLSLDKIRSFQHNSLSTFKWLSGIKIKYKGELHIFKFLIMLDDVHQLRTRQRSELLKSLTSMRLSYPVWIAERLIGLGSKEIFIDHAHRNRDYISLTLDEIYASNIRKNDFKKLTKNILDARLPVNVNFANWLDNDDEDLLNRHKKVISILEARLEEVSGKGLYDAWLKKTLSNLKKQPNNVIYKSEQLQKLFSSIAKHENRGLSLSFEEIDLREMPDVDTGFIKFYHHKIYKIPYYFGCNNLSNLATYNALEFLELAEAFYEEIYKYNLSIHSRHKSIKAVNQQKIIKRLAKSRFESIDSLVYHNAEAKNLLNKFAEMAIERSVKESSPYTPSISGFAISAVEMELLIENPKKIEKYEMLRDILASLRANNLVFIKDSERGNDKITIFYLNRLLCAHYGLALGLGGWNKFSLQVIASWMESKLKLNQKRTIKEDPEAQGKLML